ncbi:protein mono-ADP-ribosyltransferase PARP4 isoform X2 [Pygocentrus nattereri]|uniref:protein mono-ADP-ribosyltransferase PARP4 isoform X2 n=1 Tax=Pygocentrus nattereri TaxID=42514 RepID=UPI001891C543|nr:protein mono-ADP-ribosyltransferase PARP4 isoform X2 [Pygocentrus nattereri]
MAVFQGCSVVLDLRKVPYKEKKTLMSAIVDNGGSLSYVVNQKCSFVVTGSLEDLSSNRQRSALKYQIPVVGQQFVWSCLEKGVLLPVSEHTLYQQSPALTHQPLSYPGLKSRVQPQLQSSDIHKENPEIPAEKGTYLGKLSLYKGSDGDIPEFPLYSQVAKYSIFYKAEVMTWSVVELQSAKAEAGQQYRVVKSVMNEAEKTVVQDQQARCFSSEEAVDAYLMWKDELIARGHTETRTLPPAAQKIASHGLQQLLLEEKLNCSTVSQEVGTFVELIWTEALGSLSSILTVPVTSLSLNDVSRVEGLLLQVQKCQGEDEVKALLEEVNTLLPLRMMEPDSKQKLVSQKLDLCQLIRDILSMSEATLGHPFPSSLGKYRALRCCIEQVPSQSPEFQSVCQLLQDRPVQIQQILHVSRETEVLMFREELGNIKPLLHSSRPSSFAGILSRGLLLPRVGVEQHGIERTDVGNLGGGIYFSDSLSTSVKYSKPSVTDGSRLLLVCDVALGHCKDLHRRDTSLTCAPEGYNSTHGVRRTQSKHSDFEDDEYVVYNTDQVRLKYVVQYSLKEDQLKTFQPHIDMSVELIHSLTSSDLLTDSEDGGGLEMTKNPLEDVTAGLLDSSGQTLPLQAVHVRCKLMDLLSQVIIFQTYTNHSAVPIEAKYVFPLEETAAVCGFEAFINGKHVIGKVKEKEQARKEYRQAIEKGHGAYLMDQDAPDVFTISVGNLPPGATVLIKVTFITELVVRAGSILFSLPGSVAPWQQSAALNQKTQTSVEKVCVNKLEPAGEFSLCTSIEMPYEILDLECSHHIKIKRTDCKAVVSTLPDQTLSTDGFRLSFTLSQIHMPRMWVEKHPEKESEACMLVFYPDFESSGVYASGVNDVIILLDTSESMRGEAVLNARRIAVKVLQSLDRSLRVNIISFGTDYKEVFPSPNVLEDSEVFKSAKNFIMSCPAVGGSTELWRPLRSLNLLPPSHGVRNVLLISDGHIQNQPQTLQLVQDNVHHTRLFTCGLSPTANRHMLRALAEAGGGAYEFFDTKTKHTWIEKVKSQVKCMASPGCSSVAVKWQQFNPTAPPPVQAPSQLHALFSDCHTLVYGFVPHCTQATLFGDLSGQELKTMVSTTELQKTKGTFLHKLTARAIIRDYEDGSLGSSEAEHEGKKAELKSYIIELSKEFSILSQFTSFVAIEERDQQQPDSGITDVPKLVAEEDVDILPYMGWTEEEQICFEESFIYDFVETDSAGCGFFDDLESCLYDDCSLSLADHCPVQKPATVPSESAFVGEELQHETLSADVMFYSAKKKSKKKKLFSKTNEYYGAAHPRRALASGQSNANFLMPKSHSGLFGSSNRHSASIESDTPIGPFTDAKLCPSKLSVASFEDGRPLPRTPPDAVDLTLDESSISSHFYMPFEGVSLHALSPSTYSPHSPSFCDISPSSLFPQPVPPLRPGAALFSTSNAAPLLPPPPAPKCMPPPGLPAQQSASSFTTYSASPLSFSFPAFQSSHPPSPPSPLSGASLFSTSYDAPLLPPPPAPKSMPSPSLPAQPSASSFITYSASLSPFSFAAFQSSHPPPSPPPPPLLGSFILNAGDAAPPPSPPCLGPVAPDGHQSPLPQFDFAPLRSHDSEDSLKRGQRRRVALAQVSSGVGFGCSPRSSGFICSFSSSTSPVCKLEKAFKKPGPVSVERPEDDLLKMDSISEQYRRPDRINWEEIFDLQHQDGYWECTGRLSRFLGLDVDFFANVFLKERGICSLGVKAHADILRMVATLLVLQLMRVMKMTEVELFQSLFRLTDSPEPRPACYEAVKRAVDWVCWADRQYPCVCSRLEFGWNWESCTRQLLGLDSLPPCSPLASLLQRSTQMSVM